MNSTKLASIGLAAALAAVLPAISAQATSLTRTFVSAIGSDSNPCTITQPCATFARAYSLTTANGIIAALDPGKYGPLSITGPITINGNGWAAITAPAAGNGITINVNSGDKVALIGLNIDGAGTGYNGIAFNSFGSLTVTDCVLQNFFWNGSGLNTGNGILIQPTAGPVNFTVTNTTASNNGLAGISYTPLSGVPSANGIIDHVVATANLHGIVISPTSTTGGSTVVAISNSIASNNSGIGISGSNNALTSLKLSIDNVSVIGDSTGIEATSSTNALLGRSVITGNTTGINNGTSPNTFYSVQNNTIGLNGTDGGNTLNRATYTLQ